MRYRLISLVLMFSSVSGMAKEGLPQLTEEELQAALLASLEDQYMPNEKISKVESSSDSECELSSSDEMDQIDNLCERKTW